VTNSRRRQFPWSDHLSQNRSPSVCTTVERDKSMPNLRFIKREDMFAMDAAQLTGVVGRQSSCYRVAATRTRDVLHVTCTVELPLLLDSSSHLPTEETLLHVMQVLDGFLNHGVVWMTVSRADTGRRSDAASSHQNFRRASICQRSLLLSSDEDDRSLPRKGPDVP
jgi:hypothetical protein